jgi:hypothetical protein
VFKILEHSSEGAARLRPDVSGGCQSAFSSAGQGSIIAPSLADGSDSTRDEETSVDLYPWIVFIHAAAVLLFFIAHGTSMAVAFRVKRETDPDRLRALLDLSRASLGPATAVVVTIGLIAGIVAGFMGDHWGQLWIWISLALFIVVAGAMTPMVAFPLNAIRAAAGQPNPRTPNVVPAENVEELRRLQDAWNPAPIAVSGIAAFVVILYLMMLKPF